MAPTVGPATATPAYIVINTPTQVTVTVSITDPSLLPNGVNLLQTDSNGKTLSTVGVMHDDGANGDVTAGDKVFSYRLSVNQATVGQIYYRASAAFRGVLQRVLSSLVSVTFDPVSLPPDPGNAGEQTLSGVDSNANGVRDDVERYIALHHIGDSVGVQILMRYAKFYEGFVDGSYLADDALTADAGRRKTAACWDYLYPGDNRRSLDDVGIEIVNTPPRLQSYLSADALLGGRTYVATAEGQQACQP